LTDGSNGIPLDHPARVVREDPDREGLLYAGTEFGIFISFDDGKQWQSFQRNLPVTPVTDISVHRKDLAISTLGRSFWILDDISPLHELHSNASDFQLLKSRTILGEKTSIHFILPSDAAKTDSVLIEISRDQQIIFRKQLKLEQHPADQWGIRSMPWDQRYYFSGVCKNMSSPRETMPSGTFSDTRLKGPLVAP
jgi:hypothetical protein